MHEFWLKEKLLLIIGLFQFGLILIMFTIVNLSKLIWRRLSFDNRNMSEADSLNEVEFAAIAPSLEVSNQEKDAMNSPVNHENHEKSLELTSPELNVDPLMDRSEINTTITTVIAPDVHEEALTSPHEVDIPEARIPEAHIPEIDLTYKIDIAPELLTELKEISNDPTAVIDEAIRWWLRRRTFDVLDASSDRKHRVGMKSQSSKRSSQDLWND